MEGKGSPKVKWTLYLVLASMFAFVLVSELGPLSSIHVPLFSHLEGPSFRYVIVFDGGSTGTRLHVFRFLNASGGLLTLKDGFFEEVKPGLSNFAHKPKSAANSVSRLLDKAKGLIPADCWDDTPVALKATAGLRLLPSHLSTSILHEVSKVLERSPFLSDEHCVSVLDGEDEGLFAWYTLNFLLGRLQDLGRSVVSLDLGGGSTQVTFAPMDLETLVFSPKEYIITRRVQNRTLSIYSHSYLGLGLMSARLAILSLTSDNREAFQSSCIYPSDTAHIWKYDHDEFVVRGRSDGKYGFQHCYQKAVEFLGEAIDRPEELLKRDVYALSYYTDVAIDLGMIGGDGGLCTVEDYFDACQKGCSHETPDKPFLCLDCSYIVALLHHGLGFHKKKEIKMVKRIAGVEASWGLGAAFNMLH